MHRLAGVQARLAEDLPAPDAQQKNKTVSTSPRNSVSSFPPQKSHHHTQAFAAAPPSTRVKWLSTLESQRSNTPISLTSW